jgi:hypothetical protein
MKKNFFNATITVSIILIAFHLSIIDCFAQEIKLNQKVFDAESNHDIMIGYCTLAGMSGSSFDSAYKEGYAAYNPDKEIISQYNSLLNGITLVIVMGTWCSDSREQVPRFMKILDVTGHVFPDPVIICVDRDKKAGDVSLAGMDILKVPTFIVYYEGREIGRIIETPKTTMEKDFLDILKKQQ